MPQEYDLPCRGTNAEACAETVHYKRQAVPGLARGFPTEPIVVSLTCSKGHTNFYNIPPASEQKTAALFNNEMAPSKPRIDEQYWFDFSDQLVQNTQQSPAEAAGRLQELVQWLWPLFTGGAAIGLSLSGQVFSWGRVALVAAASVALVAVYWCAVYVQLPVAVEFDPRSPTEIQNAYKIGATAKNRRLKWTMVLSIVATFLAACALVWTTVAPPPSATAPWFSASLQAHGNIYRLALSGEIGMAGASGESPTSNKVLVKVQSPVSFSGSRATDEYELIPLGERGQLQTNLPLSFSADSAYVSLEWTDLRGLRIQLFQIAASEQEIFAPVDSTQMP
jgi:hypothetical protein